MWCLFNVLLVVFFSTIQLHADQAIVYKQPTKDEIKVINTLKCDDVVWDSIDFTGVVFQEKTTFRDAKITNCKLFKHAQAQAIQLAPPAQVTISEDCDVPPCGPVPIDDLDSDSDDVPPPPAPAPVCVETTSVQQPAPAAPPAPKESSFAFADFTGADLSGSSFVDEDAGMGADLSNAHISNVKLQKTNFANCNLSGIDFGGVSLVQTNLSYVNLTSVKNFNKVTSLDHAILDGVVATGVIMPSGSAGNLFPAQHLNIRHAHLDKTTYNYMDLTGADFTGSTLLSSAFNNINAPYSIFDTAIVGRIDASSKVTLFKDCRSPYGLYGSTFSDLQAPTMMDNSGLIMQNCNFKSATARSMPIGSLQLTRTDASGTVFTNIKATTLKKQPWKFGGVTSLVAAHFTGSAGKCAADQDGKTTNKCTSLGNTIFDPGNCDLTGTRFEDLDLSDVNATASQQCLPGGSNVVMLQGETTIDASGNNIGLNLQIPCGN